MKKRKFESKIVHHGKGKSFLVTIEPNGEGAHNLIVEDNHNVFFTASDLTGIKDCEVALAMFLLIRNGHSPDIMVRSSRQPQNHSAEAEHAPANRPFSFQVNKPKEDALYCRVSEMVQKSLTDILSVRNGGEDLK